MIGQINQGYVGNLSTDMLEEERYSFSTNDTFLDYEFESVGPKGIIKKVARFTEMEANVYSFGFGDLDQTTGEVNDIAVSNNGDSDKVLFTVANIIYRFTQIYSNAAVIINGSTPARTRLYQMGLNKHWIELNSLFEVLGLKHWQWHQFQPGENYDAFLGRRKDFTKKVIGP